MKLQPTEGEGRAAPDYLCGKGQAWFALVMTIALMVFDYVDRQIVVSLFPHLKAAWGLSDKELGALVSVISLTIALGVIPVAWFADRASRVKSIVVMALIWSIATISCMFTRNYRQLLAARSVVGLGEAGYGSVGAALIASHFPERLRGTILAAFFASASVGSVLGVMLGGVIAARWGWQSAFGVVGIPGLVLALLYLAVRDYRTVAIAPPAQRTPNGVEGSARRTIKLLFRSQTMLIVCIGAAAELVVVSAVWSWLPSYLNRFHGLAPDQAGIRAAIVVLCGALGSVIWGAVVDYAGARGHLARFLTLALLCVAAFAVLTTAFAAPLFGIAIPAQGQFVLIAIGGFLMTCTVGPVSAVVIDVTHPGIRATGCSVLALFQNLFGLAAGPFLTGMVSDVLGLQGALAIMPIFAVVAAIAFVIAGRSYEGDKKRASDEGSKTSVGDTAQGALA